jgi:hypothetical protein
MAVTKKDVVNTLTNEEIGHMKTLEPYIDARLTEEYTGYHVIVYVKDIQNVIGVNPSTRVLQALINMYKGAGWDVKSSHNQREGDSWLEFS